MSTLLKDIYSPAFYNVFADVAEEVIVNFNRKKFIKEIFCTGWKSKELKDRMRHTTKMLHPFMPSDFAESASAIKKITDILLHKKASVNTFGFMFLPDYIETYGINHFNESVKTMERVTQLISCEYAVRPFIIKYGDKMVNQMIEWSNHPNHHVRRLASEGIRPRLPWAMALPALKKNPQPLFPILENLKNDTSEYVRRSVANNLNDIAKDNPNLVIAIAKNWKGISKETDAIIKHGCRTLLKQGNIDVLKHFGLSNNTRLAVSGFRVNTGKVKIGNYLEFAFAVENSSGKTQTLRLEYGIYFLRANGTHSKKVFKISERSFKPKEKSAITKKQSFKIITTRKYYAGEHKVSVILNGQEKCIGRFLLEN